MIERRSIVPRVQAGRLRCVLGHVLRQARPSTGAEVVPDPLRHRKTSKCSRSSTAASSTCASPPGIAARPEGDATPAIMILPAINGPAIPKEWRGRATSRCRSRRGQAPQHASIQPRLSEPPHAQHRRSAHVRLPGSTWTSGAASISCCRARRSIRPASGGGSSQAGVDHHDRGDAIRGARGVRRRAYLCASWTPSSSPTPIRTKRSTTIATASESRLEWRAPSPTSTDQLRRQIACPIIVNIAGRTTLPPETGYALFDRIGAMDKRLYPYDGHGHDAGRVRHSAIVDRLRAPSPGREMSE